MNLLEPESIRILGRAEVEACVDAATAAIGLTLSADERADAIEAYAAAAADAARIERHGLGIDAESALAFAPLGPGDAPLPDRRRR